MKIEYVIGDNNYTLWMDEIDLVVNPHYKTVESMWLSWALDDIGIDHSMYTQIDGGVVDNKQFVVIKSHSDQVVVLIKLAFEKYTGDYSGAFNDI